MARSFFVWIGAFLRSEIDDFSPLAEDVLAQLSSLTRQKITLLTSICPLRGWHSPMNPLMPSKQGKHGIRVLCLFCVSSKTVGGP